MSAAQLDFAKLDNPKHRANGDVEAACPACREQGGDKTGNHLLVKADGRFGCVAYPNDTDHRKQIFALIGTKSSETPRTPATRTWATPDKAAKACEPSGYTLAKCWTYADGKREVLGVARYENGDGKTFRQFHPIAGAWTTGAPSGELPLLGKDQLPTSGPVVVVEGEKCFDAAQAIGLPVVCSAGGSSAAAKTDWQSIAGRNVWILPDNDAPGVKYAQAVKAILHKLNPATTIRLVRLPGLAEGGDIADWIAANNGSKSGAELCDEVEDIATAAPVEQAQSEICGGDDQPAPEENPLEGGKSLAAYAEQPIDPEQTLLGERYLCRGGALLFVGRSGMGKSSAAAQQDILWACGREAFGIVPAKPLRILGIQAENDDGDMSEMAGGVMCGLELTAEETEAVQERTLYLRWFCSGHDFLEMLDKALAQAHRNDKPFDLVRIDPLHAFIGGDVRDTKLITEFCRNGLNPILFRHGCGSVVNHHTPKINYTSRPKMEGPEWIYAAAGCADLANWAREVLVLTDADEAGGVFRLIPSKRWRRIGWRDAEGIIEREQFFAHAPHGGGICWLPATPEQIAGARARQGSGKPSVLLKIASMDASALHAHAARIVEAGPLGATDFKAGVMREFRINERDAREVVKMLTDGSGKPVQVQKIGKTSWHGTPEQLAELKAPRLAGVR